ncbi:MAG: glycoside hydrolase family 2 protein [Clostridiales bacterium]|nr:glycoside hydrolase family 2 protein [Clostridiales bacterium]
MLKIDTTISWKMKIIGEDKYYPACVPGSVYSDLLNAGRLDDPYYRDNEMNALKLMDNDFEYTGLFDVDPGDLQGADEAVLRFHGLDTVADVYLNDSAILKADNMHRTWNVKAGKLLRPCGNEIRIIFHSPVKYIRKKFEEDPAILGTEDAMLGFPHIRKAHFMFGWDWGPRLPDAGIWRGIELLKPDKAVLDKVYIRQRFDEGLNRVRLIVETAVDTACDETFRTMITVIGPDGKTAAFKTEGDIVIDDPKLWWPNGFGEQPLYTVITELTDECGNVCDCSTKRIGLRTIELSTEKDEFGSEFAFKVNGIRIFAMGADYIPEDNLLTRMSRERTFELLRQCREANFNCIRVWGGGIYPSDDLYDACDELGLIVWQDLMFACANYRLTDEFRENITAEIRDNVRRLCHHPSLGLWCGNNEMELFAGQGEWGATEDIREDYVRMYEELFPAIMAEEDPDRPFWKASPSSGGGFDEPNSPDRGDVHYWDVWHGNKPFTEYRKFLFRFLSEFGFQSFPSLRTVESFTLPEDRNVFSYVMEKHQRNAAANGKIMNYMEQMFLYPSGLDTLIYASQLLQAGAIKYGVEHLRRNRGRCMGAVYWQLNDCWPVASWSSIDYYGRWKALHYYARRFFAPVMISCEEEGLLTQSLNVNAEPFEVRKAIRLNVTNETLSERRGVVRWQLRDADSKVLREGSQDIEIPPVSSVWQDTVELPEAELYEDYVSFQYIEDGQIVSEGTVLFCPPKHFRFKDPGLRVEAEGDEIVVSAGGYAGSVEIRNDNDDLVLTDNFFDMNGGTKRVRILRGKAEGLSVRSIYDIR